MSRDSESTPRVFAIVPAAGRSRRMAAAKQLLAIDGKTMLQAVSDPLAASKAAGVLIVTHSGIADRLPPLDRRVSIVLNDDETTEMIHSVRIGLRAWSDRASVGPRDGFLICPGDHPGISAADLDACIDAFVAQPDRIVVASRAGRCGHPIIFPASDSAFVHSSACDEGLRHLPAAFPNRLLVVDCASPGVTHDVDTPDDLSEMDRPVA